jgi:hypothetical protein
VDPTSPTRRVVVPQMLPFGMSAEGLGLRAPAVVAQYRTMSSTLAGAVAGPAREAPARPRSMGRAMSPPPPAQSAPPPLEAKEDYEASRSVDLPPKPRGGLVEKAKQAFEDLKKGIASRFEPAVPEDEGALDDDIGGDLLDEASAPLGAPAPASEAAAARLRGRVVLHRFSATGTEIVFEITIEGPLDWDPALLQCVLQLLGGRTGASTVDVSRTTKKAQLFAGQIARVAITLEAAVPLEEIRSAIIVVGGEPFLVDLV